MTSLLKLANRRRKGLTLSELAIVLGGMGLVMGAVWAIVGVVWENYRFYKAQEQIITVVNNVRDYYGPIGGIYTDSTTKTFYPNGTDITQILNDDERRLIPVDMRLDRTSDTSPINHALGMHPAGSFRAVSQTSGHRLRLRLLRLSQPNCMKLLMEFPILMPELAVTRMTANTNSVNVDLTNIAAPGGAVELPITAATADSWCSVTTSAGNEVQLDFKIRN